jgi:Ran GTPase-activating protein (RanGAP) involved in mRNA processing and transport
MTESNAVGCFVDELAGAEVSFLTSLLALLEDTLAADRSASSTTSSSKDREEESTTIKQKEYGDETEGEALPSLFGSDIDEEEDEKGSYSKQEEVPVNVMTLLTQLLSEHAHILSRVAAPPVSTSVSSAPTHDASSISREYGKLQQLLTNNFIDADEFVRRERDILKGKITLLDKSAASTVALPSVIADVQKNQKLAETPTAVTNKQDAVPLTVTPEKPKAKDPESTEEPSSSSKAPTANSDACSTCSPRLPAHTAAQCPFNETSASELEQNQPPAPSPLFKPNVEATRNEIRAEIDGLTKLTVELHKIHCKAAAFGDEEAKLLWKAVKKHKPPLVRLTAAYNGIGPMGAHYLGKVLGQCPYVESISLSNNSIGDVGVVALARGLNGQTSLKSLNLDCVYMGCVGLKALSQALNTRITDLDLGHNRYGNEGAKWLARNLQNNYSLTRLSVGWTPTLRGEGAKWIFSALADKTLLHQLYVCYSPIGDDGAIALAECLKSNKGIQQLHVSGCQIGDQGIQALAQALVEHPSVKEMDIGESCITQFGWKAVADLLTGPTNITTFCTCNGSTGAEELARMIANNRSLTSLSLRYGKFNTGSIVPVLKALEVNTTIQVLKLGQNYTLDDEAAKHIAGMLQKNGSITQLDLAEASLTNEGVKYLAEALRHNRKLEYLGLIYQQNRRVTQEAVAHFERVLTGDNCNTTFQQLMVDMEGITATKVGPLEKKWGHSFVRPTCTKYYW